MSDSAETPTVIFVCAPPNYHQFTIRQWPLQAPSLHPTATRSKNYQELLFELQK